MKNRAEAKSPSQKENTSDLPESAVASYSANAGGDDYIPMRNRLRAWWTGEDVEIIDGAGNGTGGMTISVDITASDEDEDDDNDPWNAGRLNITQLIWGEGCAEPGGAKFTKKLLGWLALNSRQSVLDLTAGMGGTARSVAAAHSLWMDAIEPVPSLANEGRRLSVVAGLARQVPIAVADLENPQLAKSRYDAIYSRERLFTVRNKAGLFANCSQALKSKGQILITDYMRSADVSSVELAENWGSNEKETPNTWTLKSYTDCFSESNLQVLIAQDISEEMIDHINGAWRRIPKLISEGAFSHRQISYLVKEGEIWFDRLQAIERGDLIVGRIHAQKINNKNN